MSDLKPRTRGTCGWNEFKLATLHHQIEAETGSTFDVTRYELVWYDGTEDFALDKPGRYKVMLKRFSQRLPGNENVLHLRVQARYSPEFPVDDRRDRTDSVESTETTCQETTHSSDDAGHWETPDASQTRFSTQHRKEGAERYEQVAPHVYEIDSNTQNTVTEAHDLATAIRDGPAVTPATIDQAIAISATERPTLETSAGGTIHARVASTEPSTNQTTARQSPAAAETFESQLLVTSTTEVPSTQTSAADTPQTAASDSNDSATKGRPAETASLSRHTPGAFATVTSLPAHPTAEATTPNTPTQHVTTSVSTSQPQKSTPTNDDSDSSDSDWTPHDSNDDLPPPLNPSSDHSDHGGDGGDYDSDLDLPPAKYRRLNQPPNPRGISRTERDRLANDLLFPPDHFAVPADADQDGTDEEMTESSSFSSSSSSDEEPSLSPADRAWRKIQKRRELARKSMREEIQDGLNEIAALESGGVSTPRGTELLADAREELRAMKVELKLLGG